MFALKFIEKINNYEITIDEAIDDQEKLEKLIIRLENYGMKKRKKKEEKKVLKSAEKLFNARRHIIGFFEKGIFPFKGKYLKVH